MAQRNFPRGTTTGTGNGGAAGRYIQRNPIREVTCDRTTEQAMREKAQNNQAQPQPCNPSQKGRPIR